MTLAEVSHYIEAYNRRKRREDKELAINNYILADLIGASVGRLFKGNFPQIEEVYPSLFEEETNSEEVQKQKDELSVQRFLLFATQFNQNFEKGRIIE